MKKLCIPAVKIATTPSGKAGISVPAAYREYYQSMLAYCIDKRGGYISVTFYPPRKPRSTGEKSQNHAINGYCQQIAVKTGQPFEDVKIFCKQQAIDMGYPILEDKKGTAVTDLWGNVKGISEEDATMEDAAILIKAITRFADEIQMKLYEGETNEFN